MPRIYTRTNVAHRFWSKVNFKGPIPEIRPDLGPCWLWTGRLVTGYGRFDVSQKEPVFAPRFAYELMRGPIPAQLMPDHLCRVRACVNPSHLELVTNRENVLRGDNHVAQQARATHCVHGHELSGENLRIQNRSGSIHRLCRKCDKYNHRGWTMLRKLGLQHALQSH